MNYSEVKTISLSMADRHDSSDIVSRIDNFITVVESRLQRLISTRQMQSEVFSPYVEGDITYSLPSDAVEVHDVRVHSVATNSIISHYEYLPTEQFNSSLYGNFYTIQGGEIKISHVPDVDDIAEYNLSISYYKKIPSLIQSDENWVSMLHSDCYVFGIMVEITTFTKDSAAYKIWEKRFRDAINSIQEQNDLSIWSGKSLYTVVG